MTAGFRWLAIACAVFAASGCASFVSGAAESLSRAMLDHDDPATVEAAAPAYLLMVDSLITSDPDDEDLLRQGATLYAAYAGVFVDDPVRAKRLSARAFDYGRRAMCEYHEELCRAREMPYEQFTAQLAALDDEDDLPFLMALAQSWLIWVRANADDWNAVADLPRAEALLETVLRIDETYADGSAHVYLGMLKTVRPPALGGKPEEARRHFEQAIRLSGGANLGAKVALAENYARVVFDRELHDALLRDVLAAPSKAEGQTLMNVLAQQRAQELLSSANDYF
ncbi:MAG TPA: TRAP transporter TatT component family protein [Gammaproteobacteria bacterium]|nr:TRAP transporter TatT component family protein [Gammaproteobacteria bacterium]